MFQYVHFASGGVKATIDWPRTVSVGRFLFLTIWYITTLTDFVFSFMLQSYGLVGGEICTDLTMLQNLFLPVYLGRFANATVNILQC